MILQIDRERQIIREVFGLRKENDQPVDREVFSCGQQTA